MDGLTTEDKDELCQRLAIALKGKDVSPDAETKRKAAQDAYEQARTAVKKEKEKIKKEKLRKKEDRDKAYQERVLPLDNDATIRRNEWLAALKEAVPRLELALGARIDCTAREYREHVEEFIQSHDRASREAVQYLAAFGSDACTEDGKGAPEERAIEATPFCFIRGSGNQNFLDTVRQLQGKVTSDGVRQTLFEPWNYRDKGLSMRWDPIEDKRYALMDTKPADDGTRTVWMANLLAYRALALFPCAPTHQGLGTTAWAKVDGEEEFRWPLWEFAAAPELVGTMLQLRELGQDQLDRAALSRRGIAAVFRARRIRFPPRGASYKLNFSPARQLL
ncbi:MAG: hypothetical protein RMK29_00175 [Myxococcales bacterium]|nr:hypothetical protein [Myxococcota bacterium]MDW8280091.1 hypothetical protein [Myxococcales bacterium]